MQRAFRLQSLLEHRQDVEEALQIELARLQAQERAAATELAALQDQVQRARAALRPLERATRPDVAAIQQAFLHLAALDRSIEAQRTTVVAAGERVAAKRGELLAAMRDRRTLEILKEQHDRAYTAWVAYHEQRLVDDLVTVRYARRAVA